MFLLGLHHTRSVSHFSKQKGNGIAVYKEALPHEYSRLYFQMYKAINDKIHARKQFDKEKKDFVVIMLDHATQSLISGKRSKSTHKMSDVSVTSTNAPNASGFASVG